jgi:hypothetical protein
MPHGGYHGTIVMNDKIVQQGKKDDQGIYQIQGGIDEPSQLNIPYNPTVTSPSNQNIDKDKLTKPTGILAPLYGGSTGSIEGYNPENYDVAGQHPLSEQFVRLADKYYGGDQEAFAQTSQGQVLLNYLQDVPANKGGLMGLENPDILEKAIDQTSLFDEELTMDKDKDDQPVKSDIVNLIKNSAAVRERLTSPQYVQYLQMLQNRYPDIYSEVRPVQSGKALTELFKKVIPSYITGPLSNLLPQEEPAFFEPENAPLGLELLPLIQSPDTDQGGMNDVAQAVINQNQTPVIDPALDPSIIAQLLEENLPEGGINTFDPDSFAFSIG